MKEIDHIEKWGEPKNGENPMKPLVSIIVGTYNSAKYVIETLESAKAQTYNNIELIITDDGSTDNTVEICQDWLEKNKKRFFRTELITVEKNTGIPSNANRGLSAAAGEWIKFFAGDDIIINNAISLIFKEVHKYPNDQFFFSQGLCFEEVDGKEFIYDYLLPEKLPKEVANNELDSEGHYKLLLTRQYVFTPSAFIKKDVFDKVGGFDEQYTLMEDYPFFLKCAKKGIRFIFSPIITVKYRSHNDSISHNNRANKFVVKTKFKKCYNAFVDEEILPNTSTIHKIGIYWIRFFENLIVKMGNKRNITNRILINIGRVTNPHTIYCKLKDKFL